MTTKNEEKTVECPKCKATREKVRFVFLMETQCLIEAESPGELVVDAGCDVEPAGGTQAFLLCIECGTRWPLAKGIAVQMVADGEKRTVFGPDGRSR